MELVPRRGAYLEKKSKGFPGFTILGAIDFRRVDV